MLGFPDRSAKKLISKIAIFGMVLQAFLSIFHTVALASGKDSNMSLFSQTIVICTGNGFKRVPVNDDGFQKQDTHPASFECQVCLNFSDNKTLTSTDNGSVAVSLNGALPQFRNVDPYAGAASVVYDGRGPPRG